MKKMNILFVCRYNRFRSRIAKAYFDKINKNKLIKTKSAGLIKGSPLNPKTVKLIKKEFGLNINGSTQGLTSPLLVWQNITVIVADNVPPKVFDRNKKFNKKVIVFKIKDILNDDNKSKIKVTKEIIKKIDQLAKRLEKLK